MNINKMEKYIFRLITDFRWWKMSIEVWRGRAPIQMNFISFISQSNPLWAGPSGEADHRPAGQEVGQPEEEIQGTAPHLLLNKRFVYSYFWRPKWT